MTTTTTTSKLLTAATAAGRFHRLAGPAYVATWIAGLAVASTSVAMDAEPAEVVRHYAEHGGTALTQSLLVHGAAAVALVTVADAVRRATMGTGRRAARAGFTAAAVAGGLSLVQMVLGIVLATGAVGADEPERAATLLDLVNRTDGLKMVALGAFVGAGVLLARRNLLPRWLAPVGVVTVALLMPAALAYVTLNASLAVAAGPALLGLLVWVCAAGLAATRR